MSLIREHCRVNFEQDGRLDLDGRVVRSYNGVEMRPKSVSDRWAETSIPRKPQNDRDISTKNCIFSGVALQQAWTPPAAKPHPCDVIQRLSLAYAAEGLETAADDHSERSWDPWDAMDRLLDWRPARPWYHYVMYTVLVLHGILTVLRIALLWLS